MTASQVIINLSALSLGRKLYQLIFFFQFSDENNSNPLVIGFQEGNYAAKYFTYKHISKYADSWFYSPDYEYGLPPDGVFLGDELISRLLDELGIYVPERRNKFVIRLGEKPKSGDCTYPKGGKNAGKITVKKSGSFLWFDKYEHSINTGNNVQLFYVSFNHDSLYMDGNRNLGKLRFVDVYFNNKNGNKFVIIVFKFEHGCRFYEYSDFHFQLFNQSKSLSELTEFQEHQLTKLLIEEYDTQNSFITFLLDQKGSEYSGSIKVLEERTVQSDNYKIYAHSVSENTYTYKSNILLNNRPFKVDGTQYKDIVKKVTVYFLKDSGNNVYAEPFLIGIDGTKFFSKNKNDDSWSSIDIKDSDVKTKLETLKIDNQNFESSREQVVQELKATPQKLVYVHGVVEHPNSEALLVAQGTTEPSSGKSGLIIGIVGGVATTAIGAGAIGGGYYAYGVLSVIRWLI